MKILACVDNVPLIVKIVKLLIHVLNVPKVNLELKVNVTQTALENFIKQKKDASNVKLGVGNVLAKNVQN